MSQNTKLCDIMRHIVQRKNRGNKIHWQNGVHLQLLRCDMRLIWAQEITSYLPQTKATLRMKIPGARAPNKPADSTEEIRKPRNDSVCLCGTASVWPGISRQVIGLCSATETPHIPSCIRAASHALPDSS